MKELIYKESALKVLDDYKTDMVEGIPNAYSMARKRMAGLMPKRGKWIESGFEEMKCSVCGSAWDYCDNDCERFNYCPSCGCAMTKE